LEKFTFRRFIAIILIFIGFSIAWEGTKEINITQCKIVKKFSKTMDLQKEAVVVNNEMKEFYGKIQKINCSGTKAFLTILIDEDQTQIIPVDDIFKINDIKIQNIILNKVTDITMSGVLKIVIGSFILILVVSFRTFFWKRKKASI